MKKPDVSWLKMGHSIPQLNFLWHRAGEVKTMVHEVVGRLLAWSMIFASAGTFPLVGFHGEELDPKSFRYSKRGQTLTGGWRHGWLCDYACDIFSIFEIKPICLLGHVSPMIRLIVEPKNVLTDFLETCKGGILGIPI